MRDSLLREHDSRDALIAELIEHERLQDALMRAMSDRISRLEGVDDPALDLCGTTTIERASFATGYSQSGIRKRIASHKITAIKRGGRWFVDRASLTSKVR